VHTTTKEFKINW